MGSKQGVKVFRGCFVDATAFRARRQRINCHLLTRTTSLANEPCQQSKSRPHIRLYTSSTRLYSQHASSTSEQVKSDMHDRDVAAIIQSIRTFHERGEPYRIAHGSTNSTRTRAPGTNTVDISRLNRVLHVDREAMTAVVEPNVPMDRLVEHTLDHGLIPPVVMEFPGITVGGGFAGTCAESSSFKHGFFHENIAWADLVLANGDLVRVSPTSRPDLFSGAAGALGTLGVTTRVCLRLIKAEKYVDVTVHPLAPSTHGDIFEHAARSTRALAQRPDIDHLDAILFSPARGAVLTGTMTSAPSALPIRRFSRPADPWYYMHIAALCRDPATLRIPLPEYLFRYDRGGFWVGRAAFTYFGFPFTRLTRRVLDDFLHTRMMYAALHASGHAERYLVQDFGLPFSTAPAFMRDVTSDTGVWPLWLCPLKTGGPGTGKGGFHPHSRLDKVGEEEEEGHVLNVGVYGWPPRDGRSFAAVNRRINDLLAAHGGTKWLYAQSFYTPEEFWEIYNRKSYEALREKYEATGLPSVSEKVAWDGNAKEAVRDVWPAAGIRGLRAAIKSKTYLDARKSRWRDWS